MHHMSWKNVSSHVLVIPVHSWQTAPWQRVLCMKLCSCLLQISLFRSQRTVTCSASHLWARHTGTYYVAASLPASGPTGGNCARKMQHWKNDVISMCCSELDFRVMPTEGLFVELETRLRCHRLVAHGLWICDEFPRYAALWTDCTDVLWW